LDHVQPGFSSSGATETPHSLDTGHHIAAKLFTSPSSTPLDGSHDTHRKTSTQRPSSSTDADRDEADDVVDMGAFP
jgi:hypothetical protein